MPDLTVVIVNWNAKDYLSGCLESLRESHDSGLVEVVVVDNASEDGSLEMVEQQFSWVRLVRVPANLGFARGNNLGLEASSTPLTMFLNSDTLVTREALALMVSAMQRDSDLYVLGCQHIDADGQSQNPFGRFPSLKSEFVTMTGAFKWPLIRWIIDLRKEWRIGSAARVSAASTSAEAESRLRVVYVDYVSGAGMMFKTKIARDIGGMDPRYFFYSEDADFCLMAREAGGKTGFMPNVTIVHYGGGSYGDCYLPILRQWMVTRLAFFGKHYGSRAAWALRAVYAAAGAASLVKWCCVFLTNPRRRPAAVEWIRFWLGSCAADGREEPMRRMGRTESA